MYFFVLYVWGIEIKVYFDIWSILNMISMVRLYSSKGLMLFLEIWIYKLIIYILNDYILYSKNKICIMYVYD